MVRLPEVSHESRGLSSRICRYLATTLFLAMLVIVTPLAASDVGQNGSEDRARSESEPAGKQEKARKSIRAIKANPHSPSIDGKLNESVWGKAEWISGFAQRLPNEGEPASEQTEVAIVYDDHALYIGARLLSQNADELLMHLEKRDNQGPAEQFIVSIDSYHNRRTGFGFGVNTSGVRFDRYYASDSEGGADYSWNPVWEAATSRDSKGWYAEMRIPFSQLRFNEKEEQVWGINFNRWIPNKNEDSYWIYVPQDEAGFISHFGELEGIAGIASSSRIEIVPYFASDASFIDGDFSRDPFRDGSDLDPRIGGDVKMGLATNLTLDATFNPDFGQVEADPAEVNLSAFETFFDERRPFFNEGSSLLEGNGPSYYYSRRIGAGPHAYGSGDIVDQPNNSTILGAAKVSGRLQSGTSVGYLAALTDREFARNYDIAADSTYETQVEPYTLYNVARVEQQFGKNNSTVGVSLTSVSRDLNGVSALESRLHKNAYSGGADWVLRFKNGIYQISGYTGFSHVRGSKEALLRTQRSSARYFQRPDADYVEVDSNRTTMTGAVGFIRLAKPGGNHWVGAISGGFESPEFELNDIGSLSTADEKTINAYIAYRENKPGKYLRNHYSELWYYSEWNYGGLKQFNEMGTYNSFTLLNYWGGWFNMARQFPGNSDTKTRGGPLMRFEDGYSWGAGVHSDHNKPSYIEVGGNYGIDVLDGWLWSMFTYFKTRVGNRASFSVEPSFTREDQPRQYVTTLDDAGGGELTYGSRYIFSRLARNTLRLQFRMNYYFSPDLSLELYAEPFATNGRYHQHAELVRGGDHEVRNYEQDPNAEINLMEDEEGNKYYLVNDNGSEFTIPYRDFGFRSFRSNVVLRWEFRPGSTAYLVWQRNLSENREPGKNVGVGSLFDSFGAQGEDFIALKISYWLPISQFIN